MAEIPSYLLDRKIIHIDMDAFFASIEQRDRADLQGKPVAVGGSPTGRGVVAAASYEARKFGVRSAMSSAQAIRLCPDLIFVRSRFAVYRHVSRVVMAILREYSELVQPVSVDEAFVDATRSKKGYRYASQTAKDIRKKIYEMTGLTASAGVAPNKFLAKIASDLNKPNGMAVIQPHEVEDFLQDLPIRKIPGVGKVTEEKFLRMGISTVGRLRKLKESELERRFGKNGSWFYRVARGEDTRKVHTTGVRKSLGAEGTFERDLLRMSDLQQEVARYSKKVADGLQKTHTRGKTITLKVKYKDFTTITRSKTVDTFVDEHLVLEETALELLTLTDAGKKPIRLLGVSVSNFEHEHASTERSDQLLLEF